tara:strand:- start:42936 stop:44585 length:1650 start_codon:yes stop_codon:yes gene_type:complete
MLDQFFEEEEEEASGSADGIAVGIDLGTTNTVVAHADHRGPVALLDEFGRMLQPSIVAFLPDGSMRVGQEARGRRLMDPRNTIFSAKRIIGQPFSSPRLQKTIGNLPYEVVEGANQEPLIKTRAGEFSVPDIAAKVVAHARDIASASAQRPVSHCVVTVPANFNDAQREATRRAVKSAGLEVLRILNEPTAAALAYGHGRNLNQQVVVFDMGGGTFDLSVLAVRRGLYEVLATGGDAFLGGDDMDHALADELARRFLKEHRLDPRTDPQSLTQLLISAEGVKMSLSRQDKAEVHIDELAHGVGGKALGLHTTITKAEFEDLISPIVERALECAAAVLAEADLLPQSVDEVLLVGGATHVPLVKKRVSELFGKAAQGDIDPMQVVALGAAAHAQALYAPGTIARVAASQDGSVAGASTEEGPIDLLLDVTSHPVGLATAGGYAEVLLDKNTPIPAEVTRTFSTARDNQDWVTLKVCQGDDRQFEKNELLGELKLEGIRPAPRGQVRIEVSFLINADGLLQVSARDTETGGETSANLSLFGLSNEELEVVE